MMVPVDRRKITIKREIIYVSIAKIFSKGTITLEDIRASQIRNGACC